MNYGRLRTLRRNLDCKTFLFFYCINYFTKSKKCSTKCYEITFISTNTFKKLLTVIGGVEGTKKGVAKLILYTLIQFLVLGLRKTLLFCIFLLIVLLTAIQICTMLQENTNFYLYFQQMESMSIAEHVFWRKQNFSS